MTDSLAGNLLIASTLVPDSVFSRSVCLIVHHDENGAIGVMLNRPISPPPAELIRMLIGGGDATGDHDSTESTAAGPEPSAACGAKTPTSAQGRSRLPKVDQTASVDAKQSLLPEPGHAEGGSGLIPLDQASSKNSGLISVQSGEPLVHFGGPVSGPVVAVHGRQEFAEAEAGQGVYMAAQKEHLEQLVKAGSDDFRLIVGHSAWSADQLSKEFSAGYWHILPATSETALPVRIDLWPYLIRRATGASIASWVGARDSGGWTGLN